MISLMCSVCRYTWQTEDRNDKAPDHETVDRHGDTTPCDGVDVYGVCGKCHGEGQLWEDDSRHDRTVVVPCDACEGCA